jgi:hypothetical protein
VAEWLRNAYLDLTRKTPLNFEELRSSEPYTNRDSRNLEARSIDWETLARISNIQTKMTISILSGNHYNCDCDSDSGYGAYPDGDYFCKCQILFMVDEAFKGELESLKENPEHVEHPLPCKPIFFLYRQQHRFGQSSTS